MIRGLRIFGACSTRQGAHARGLEESMTEPSPMSRIRVLASHLTLAYLLAVPLVARAALAPNPRPTQPMHLVDEYVIGGDGPWGELEFDLATKRVFLARTRSVQVVDTQTRASIKDIPCPEGLHSIALARDLRRGFVASAADSTVLEFDLDSLRAVKTIKLSPAAAGTLVYDAGTSRVFVLDPGGTITAIDAKSGELVGSRDLAAQPQAAVADGAGALFVALPMQDAIAVLDARTLLERTRWPLDAGARPTALAYDATNKRLFSAGKGLLLSVLETDRGRAVTRVPLGGGVERLVFDPGKHLIISIGNGGVSSTLWQQSADQYSMVATIGTHVGVRTIALDTDRHFAYLVAGPPLAPTRPARLGKADPGVVARSTTLYVLAP
jgi:hypothetical protein